MARLRLLSGRFRLVLCAALAACLGIFALGELAIRSAVSNGQQVNLLLAELALLALALLAITVLILLTRLAVERATMEHTITSRSSELVELWSHLQDNTEKEKADLARNLHDELGGLLTAARMDLAWLQRAAAGQDPSVLARLQQLADELTDAMDVKRRVVENLRPALLDHFGLPTAMQNYFEEMCQKAGLSLTTTLPDESPDLSDELAIALFRIGQESLTNIVRHARARKVQLELAVNGDSLTLVIADDGVGIDRDPNALQRSHGIRGMRHRIESLGGTFELTSGKGTGTTIRIRSPRERCAAPARAPGIAR
jgi:signal transduction histidine kinase